MRQAGRWAGIEDDQAAADRQTASLAGLAAALALAMAGLFLVQVLRHQAVVEDCLLAGRLSCDAIVASTR